MAVLSPCPVLCAGQLGVPPVRPREDPGVEFPSGASCGGAGSSLQLLGVGESQLCPSPPSWGCVWILVLTLTSFSASAMLPSSSYSIRHSISMPAMRNSATFKSFEDRVGTIKSKVVGDRENGSDNLPSSAGSGDKPLSDPAPF
ncbi:uncharacterized protein LOC116464837 [Hylobates moloch]|uniref:uncharacterized protein LOC116464837 n=1 Tax=Hylobates moloch TaxID=81572 RepID=UPI0013637402|nr:uncharacterized protein LOC116464837 [Hylobates moloch]